MVEDICVGLVFFVVVLPMFLLNCVSFLSRAVSEKFSSCQVLASCLAFPTHMAICQWLAFLGCCFHFLINCVSFLSCDVSEKFSSCQVLASCLNSCLDFSDPFSEVNLWLRM